jgi:transposase
MSYEIEADYEQQFIFPPSLEDFIGKDDPARFIREFVDSVEIGKLGFKTRESKDGRPNYSSRLLLKVWIYGWFDKVKSIRELEKLCKRDVGMIWLCGLNQPDHNTLWRFYRDNKDAIKKIFRKTVRVAFDNNLISMVLHAIDGTKIRADVSLNKILKRRELKEKLENLNESIEKYFEQVEGFSKEEESIELKNLPGDLQNQKDLRKRIRESLSTLEGEGTGNLSKTNKDSRIMQTGDGKRFAYNSQAVVDSDKGIIVAADVLQDENDARAMNRMLDKSKENLGEKAEENVFDGGYFSGKELHNADAEGYNVLVNIPEFSGNNVNVPIDSPYHQNNFKYEQEVDKYQCPFGGTLTFQRYKTNKKRNYTVKVYHCEKYKTCLHRNECSKSSRGRTIDISPYKETVEKYKMKMEIEESRKLLKRRMAIVEPVFGHIKNVLGFRRFKVRGLDNVRNQWHLICTIMNLRKIHKEWVKGAVILN